MGKGTHNKGLADAETLRVVLASDSPGLASGATVGSVVNGSIQTSSTGSNFSILPAGTGLRVVLINRTGVDIEVQRNGAGEALIIEDGTFWTFQGITNANQLGVRRVDQDNAQVTLQYELEN